MEIGPMIREIRKKRGMHQKDLALAAGVKPALMNKYEQGTVKPGIEVLIRIANGLGTEASQLVARLEGRQVAPKVVEEAA